MFCLYGETRKECYGCSAVCMRWLWLQRTDPSRLWAQLRVKEDRITNAFFQASTIAVLGDDTKFRLWVDAWLNVNQLASWPLILSLQ
jgi:hypothetical protein